MNLPWPLLWSHWWMLHKQTSEPKPNPRLFPLLNITHKEGCCDKVDWAGSHPDFNFIGVNSNEVISVLWLYSHWVSDSPLVHNTFRLPHLGWLVCREKKRRGNHYSSLLLLAWDEALNPACMQVLRGHWENNTEKQHEWCDKQPQSPVQLHLLLNNPN